MERDLGKEIDALREQLEALTKRDEIKYINGMFPKQTDKRLVEMQKELCEKADGDGGTGIITYLGVFASGDRQSNWIRNQVDTDSLLALIESNAAARVLACIGSNDRLNLLLALLRAPRTAAQLVEQCGYNTTGQVYHHLKPLLAAGLVKEDDITRGSYVIQPHRVQGIIMLLAGISDMLDPKYTQGSWESMPEQQDEPVK